MPEAKEAGKGDQGAADEEHRSARRLGSEIAKVGDQNLKAFRDQDRVIFVIQNAPEELRRLADALERINVREIQALVAFQDPKKDKGR